MLLGSAAGKVTALALATNILRPRTGMGATATAGAAANGSSTSLGAVPILLLQQTVAADQPLVKYDDLSVPPPNSPVPVAAMVTGGAAEYKTAAVYTAMQVLGPWGVADGLDRSYLAAVDVGLTRALASHWLAGAHRATASTVGHLAAPPPSRCPTAPTFGSRGHIGDRDGGGRGDPPPTSSQRRWKDFGPCDRFFDDAVWCAAVGVFPAPDPAVAFAPLAPLDADSWQQWVELAIPRHAAVGAARRASASSLSTGDAASNIRGGSSPILRGDAAVVLYTRLFSDESHHRS
jgi:hypothetical protein